MITLSNAIKQRIIDIASQKGITLHKLALESGVPYSTLSSFLNGKCTSMTMTTLLHICEGADISIREFFNDPMFKKKSVITKK